MSALPPIADILSARLKCRLSLEIGGTGDNAEFAQRLYDDRSRRRLDDAVSVKYDRLELTHQVGGQDDAWSARRPHRRGRRDSGGQPG